MCPLAGHWLLIGALALLVGVPSFIAGWIAGGIVELRSRLRGKP